MCPHVSSQRWKIYLLISKLKSINSGNLILKVNQSLCDSDFSVHSNKDGFDRIVTLISGFLVFSQLYILELHEYNGRNTMACRYFAEHDK